MKKISILLLALLMVFAFTACDDSNVHDHVFVDTVKDGKAIKVCSICGEEAASTFSVITKAEDFNALKEDVEGVVLANDLTVDSAIAIDRDLIIALNGKIITGEKTRAINVKSGDVEIVGKGQITVTEGITDNSSVIRVGDNDGEEREISLKIGKDVVVSSDFSYGVTVFGSKTKETVVIDGTVNTKIAPAVSGNGSAQYANTNITINGKLSTTEDYCIYHPQAGKITINGEIVGLGGIELKGGTLILGDGCLVKATATEQSHETNNNGTSTSGYAIALVKNKNYAGAIDYEENKNATVEGIVKMIVD